MAHTAHRTQEAIQEHFDPPHVLAEKLDRLADLVRNCRHLVAFTGAGISTSAGVPDFRGPQGAWTLRAQGRQRTAPTTDVLKAFATPTHMALVKLERDGFLKHLISQNCDGMHRKSGFDPRKLSELHGNSNMEECEDCRTRFFRDYKAYRMVPRSRDHFTGRNCALCGGRLLEWTVDFNQSLPRDMLDSGIANARTADVVIALGSSLKVRPACQLPEIAGKNRNADLVIVNLQKTPLDNLCSVRIFARSDDVMVGLMARLGIDIPTWSLHRRVLAYPSGLNSVVLQGVDPFQPHLPATLFRSVSVPGMEPVTVEPMEVVAPPEAAGDLLDVTLTWFGHYGEHNHILRLDLAVLRKCPRGEGIYIELSFDPYTREWTELRRERATIQLAALGKQQWEAIDRDFDEAFEMVTSAGTDRHAIASSLSVMQKVIVNATTKGQTDGDDAAKYRKVRLSNPKIKAAVTDTHGSIELMISTGFALSEIDGETYLVYPTSATSKPWLSRAMRRMNEYAKV